MSTTPLPTYVEPAPAGADQPDPASAALVFRVGVADTDYLAHGELHVLTRLLSASVDHLPVRHRAVVGTVSSSVEVIGAPDDVAQAVHTLAAWLRDPDWSDRRAVTEEVLAEGATLGGADDELAGAALCRWGRRGIGLIGLAPAGLAATRVEELEAWRTGYFTAGNSCLIADHAALGDLELALPPGPAVPPHGRLGLALPLPGQLPRVDRDGNPVSAPSGAATITALTHQPAVTRVLAGVLTTTLNAREGLDGAPTRTRALSVGSQLLWLYEHGATGPTELYAALRSVAHGELDPDVLTSTVERLSGIPRGNALARAERTALTQLWGLPLIRDLQEVTAEEVVAEARDALPSVLVLGEPERPGVESEDGARDRPSGNGAVDLRLIEGPQLGATGQVHGRYRSKRRTGGVLTLTEQTCEIVRGTDRTGVTWDDLVAVHYRTVDRRVLVPRHGQPLELAGSDWRGGKAAVAAIDAMVPAHLVVFPPAVASELRPSAATTAALEFAADLEEGAGAAASSRVGATDPSGEPTAPAAPPTGRASRKDTASASSTALTLEASSGPVHAAGGAGAGAGEKATARSNAQSPLVTRLAGLPRPALVAALAALLLIVVLIALLAG